jgi:hypothetical protein
LAAFFLLPFSCNESKENDASVCPVVDDHVSSLAAAAAGRCSLTLRSFRTDLGLSGCYRRVFCFLCCFISLYFPLPVLLYLVSVNPGREAFLCLDLFAVFLWKVLRERVGQSLVFVEVRIPVLSFLLGLMC